MSKIIPIAMIVVGGVMIYGGIHGDNPLTVFKGILSGTYTPTKGGIAGSAPVVDPSTLQANATAALNNPTPGTISASVSPGIAQHLNGSTLPPTTRATTGRLGIN